MSAHICTASGYLLLRRMSARQSQCHLCQNDGSNTSSSGARDATRLGQVLFFSVTNHYLPRHRIPLSISTDHITTTTSILLTTTGPNDASCVVWALGILCHGMSVTMSAAAPHSPHPHPHTHLWPGDAHNGPQRRPTAANEGERRPTAAHAGQRRSTAANEAPHQPTKPHTSQRSPTPANDGPQQPTKSKDGQRRLTAAKTKLTAANAGP
jgi:hypothetical protein